ncbi:unnamed protein product [Ectocarpus sp. CCAP 1310/34]|nr:unnamed protein product [Ectocarpus sp. CCAP 1310/34]
MSLPLATLRELQKLAALKAKGVILERQYEVTKKHVRKGNSLSSEDWEAFDLARDLRSSGVFSEEGWTTQGVILERQYEVTKKHVRKGNSLSSEDWEAFDLARDLRSSGVFSEEGWTTQVDGSHVGHHQQRSPYTVFRRRCRVAAAAAGPAAHGAPNRGKRQREDASKGLLNIYNSLAIGSGEPVLRTCAGVQEYVPGVSFASPAPAPRVRCPHCPTTFVNTQGLGVHMKTNHSRENMFQGQRLQRLLGDDAKGDVLPWERAGPGRCHHVKVDGIRGAASFVLQPKRLPDIDLESDGFTRAEPKSARRGAAKRNC